MAAFPSTGPTSDPKSEGVPSSGTTQVVGAQGPYGDPSENDKSVLVFRLAFRTWRFLYALFEARRGMRFPSATSGT